MKVFRATWKAGPLVIIGIGCYFLSGFLDNLWRMAGDLLWIYPEYIPPVEPPDPKTVHKHDFARRLYTLSSQIMRAAYCLIIAGLLTCALRWFASNKWNYTGILLGALVFWITAIAETFSVIEYVLCKVVADRYSMEALSKLWELEGQTSACERLGGPAMAYAAPTVTTLVLAWVLWRAYQVWRHTTHNPTVG